MRRTTEKQLRPERRLLRRGTTAARQLRAALQPMTPNLKHPKHPWPKPPAVNSTAQRTQALKTLIPDPRLHRRTEHRPPRVVHDDALWHEGPDEERMHKTTRHEGPREPRRDRPSHAAHFDRSR